MFRCVMLEISTRIQAVTLYTKKTPSKPKEFQFVEREQFHNHIKGN